MGGSGDIEEAELYFGYLLDLVKLSKNNLEHKVELYGQIKLHWYSCKKRKLGEDCVCQILIQRLHLIHEGIEERQNLQTNSAADFLHDQ